MDDFLFKVALVLFVVVIFGAMLVDMHLKHEAYKAYREAVKREKNNGSE